MFDRLSSFRNHSMSEIRNLVRSHYTFFWQQDTSAYVTDLLYKDKYLCDDIENVSNLGHDREMFDKTTGLRVIFSPYNW